MYGQGSAVPGVVRSEISRNPEASYIDGQEGRLKWNYTTGLELKAILDVYCHSERSEESILSYVDAWYNSIIPDFINASPNLG